MSEQKITTEDIEDFSKVTEFYVLYHAIDAMDKENFAELPYPYLKYILAMFASDYPFLTEDDGEMPMDTTFSVLQELFGKERYTSKLGKFLDVFTKRLADEVFKGIEAGETYPEQYGVVFQAIAHALLLNEGWEDTYNIKMNKAVEAFCKHIDGLIGDNTCTGTKDKVAKAVLRVYSLHYDNTVVRGY